MPSVGETYVWEADLGQHPQAPSTRLDALDIGAEAVVADAQGDELLRVGLDEGRDDGVTLDHAGQRTLELTLPPHTLDAAAIHLFQVAVTVDGQRLLWPAEPEQVRFSRAIV